MCEIVVNKHIYVILFHNYLTKHLHNSIFTRHLNFIYILINVSRTFILLNDVSAICGERA